MIRNGERENGGDEEQAREEEGRRKKSIRKLLKNKHEQRVKVEKKKLKTSGNGATRDKM